MTKNLRKRHLQIWLLLLVLLPAGIISARLVTPVQVNGKLLQPAATAALPILLKSFSNENYTIHVRCNMDTSQLQLEWINKQTLVYPTLTIYEVYNPNKTIAEAFAQNNLPDSLIKIENAELIGRIEAMGTYHFYLPQQEKKNQLRFHFILYDFIHKKNIAVIKII